MNMTCPNCSQPLTRKPIGDVTVDECRGCRGIWFDPGEVDDVKDQVAPELRWMDLDLWRQQADFKVSSDPLFCPRCTDVALTRVADEDNRASIRLCTQCGGSWLSAEELETIITALSGEVNRRNLSDHLKESLRQAGELFSGNKDLISEWKDLKAVLRLLKYRFFIENPKLESVMKGLQKTLPL